MEITAVIIENDIEKYKDDPLIWTLKDTFIHVEFCDKPYQGVAYIKANLDKNMIVLLDIDFSGKEENGHEVLKKIAEMSKLIPVILWTAIDENTEPFSDFINNHAFGFLSKSATTNEAMSIIKKAVIHLENSLDNTIEDWIINKEEDKDKPIYITTNGTSYSLNQILHEIRTQSEVGKGFSRKLNSLTIDLLLRKKEGLND
jgi:DNA-binding NtrC family response regulator